MSNPALSNNIKINIKLNIKNPHTDFLQFRKFTFKKNNQAIILKQFLAPIPIKMNYVLVEKLKTIK